MRVLKTVEEFRCETEDEAKAIINDMKEKEINGYRLTAWDVKQKTKKSKGEIIDEAYLLKITKQYGEIWDE